MPDLPKWLRLTAPPTAEAQVLEPSPIGRSVGAQRTLATATPFAASVSARAGGPGAGMVRLWDPEGEGFHMDVEAGDVDHWLSKGFKRDPIDVDATAERLQETGIAMLDAIAAYYRAVRDYGYVNSQDGSEKHAAERAVADWYQTWLAFHTGVQRAMPRLQAEANAG